MEAHRTYADTSRVEDEAGGAVVHLFPDLGRAPVYLRARLRAPLMTRDALLVLGRAIRSEHYVSRQEIEARMLDPVITVTDGPVWFEAFSADQSTWALFRLDPEQLERTGPTRPGTTNIAMTRWFESGLARLRSTSTATLEVGHAGVGLADTGGTRRVERRIDLPTRWVQGFVEVAAAARLPGTEVVLHPRDLRKVLRVLRGRKARCSPRAWRWLLEPGRPPVVQLEPWDETYELQRSRHAAETATSMPVWGRRRLLLLLDLVGHAREVVVRLAGAARPSFWTVLLDGGAFTLGLSPWAARDWTRTEAWTLFEPEGALDPEVLAGRVLTDPSTGQSVRRALWTGTPPPPSSTSARLERARALAAEGAVEVAPLGGRLVGSVRGQGGTYEVALALDAAGRIEGGSCGCAFFRRFSLLRGPCKHLLAVREATRS